MPYEAEAWLRKLLVAGQALTRPDDVNEEYVRGQAELIASVLPLPGPARWYYALLTDAITGTLKAGEAARLILEKAEET